MLDMKACPECEGNKLRKESLNVFLSIEKDKKIKKYNISDFQRSTLNELIFLVQKHQETANKDKTLLQRITNPLIDRSQTIQDL
jgi:excinuclease UvrABC ATPase subunit